MSEHKDAQVSSETRLVVSAQTSNGFDDWSNPLDCDPLWIGHEKLAALNARCHKADERLEETLSRYDSVKASLPELEAYGLMTQVSGRLSLFGAGVSVAKVALPALLLAMRADAHRHQYDPVEPRVNYPRVLLSKIYSHGE